MSKNEIGIEEGRKRFGDLVIAAEQRGEVTIVTRYGKPAAAIVPISRLAKEQPMTVADIAREFNVTEADVLALVDQLTTLDGSENVMASEEKGVVTLTADAAAVIREQLATD